MKVGASTCELLPEFLRQFVSQLRRLSQGDNQNQATLQSGRYICVKRENKYQTEFESLAKALTSASGSHIVDQPICGHLAKESLLNLLRGESTGLADATGPAWLPIMVLGPSAGAP